MKHEIIYTDEYALIVSDEKIKEGDCVVDKHDVVYKQETDKIFPKFNGAKKIIAHRPLRDSVILEGVPLLPEFSQGEDEIAKEEAEKLHDKGKHEDWDIYNELVREDAEMIKTGYKKAKETYKYTKEDLKNAFYNGWLYRGEEYQYPKALNEFIQSLQQLKRPKYFQYKMDWENSKGQKGSSFVDVALYEENIEQDDAWLIPKTITNSQGQTELVGEYIYG